MKEDGHRRKQRRRIYPQTPYPTSLAEAIQEAKRIRIEAFNHSNGASLYEAYRAERAVRTWQEREHVIKK